MKKRVFNITNDHSLDNNFKSAIIYDLSHQKYLYKKNEKEIRNIASLTKLMTSLLLVENKDIDDTIKVPTQLVENLKKKAFTVAGFQAGDIITTKDLLYGILLPSGADACKITAFWCAGNDKDFVKLMNIKAKELGLNRTHFMSTIGYDQYGHYSTAEDLVKLMLYIVKNPTMKTALETMEYTTSTGITLEHTFIEYSNLFKNDHSYLKAGKTGSTKKAGLCVSVISKINNNQILLVGLSVPKRPIRCSDHLIQASKMFNYIEKNYNYENLCNESKYIQLFKIKYSFFNIKTKISIPIIISFKTAADKKLYYKFLGNQYLGIKIKPKTKLGYLKVFDQNKKLLYTKKIVLGKKKYLEYIIKLYIIPVLIVFIIFIVLFLLLK